MNETGAIHALVVFGFPVVVALLAASVGAVTDVVEYRVHNKLTFPLVITGLVYHAAIGGWSGFSTSLAGTLFGFGVLIVPWLLGLMGAGDVKLLAGVGAWLGLTGAVVVFLVTAAATCVCAIVLIVCRGKIHETLLTTKVIFLRFVALGTYLGKDDLVDQLSTGDDHRLRVIPFAAMVPIGIVGLLLWFAWFRGGL